MKFPVKLNRSFWPRFLTKVLPSAEDPRLLINGEVDEVAFSSMISTFKFGSTFKSTKPKRFPLTLDLLALLPFSHPPIILDVGASDGITSLDVMKVVPFYKYFVTDLNLYVWYSLHGRTAFFYNQPGSCILAVDNKWVFYPDYKNALFPFDWISHSCIERAPQFQTEFKKIFLISPALLKEDQERLRILPYDILEHWPGEKVDLIIAANILNRSYFTDELILIALGNLLKALNDPGRLAIVDNRVSERATIFQMKDRKVSVERRIAGGTEIEALVMALSAGGISTSPSIV